MLDAEAGRVAILIRMRDPPWRRPGWLEPALTWTDASLADAGLRRTGPPEARERAYSVVLRFPTDGGDVFLKETADTMANDAGLTSILHEVAPDLVVQPLAVDAGRRRMLLPHAGERLRDRLEADPDPVHWERILPRYAELQLAAASRTQSLQAAGALDRGLDHLAQQLAELLDDPQVTATAQLRALVPRVAAVAAELRDGSIPLSVQHDDLHDGNVLVEGTAAYRVVDWGDAYVGHPFGTLLVTLRSAAGAFSWADDGPEVRRLRDGYLEPWRAVAPDLALEREVRRSCWLAMVGRALIWRAVGVTAAKDDPWDWRAAVGEWLAELAASTPA